MVAQGRRDDESGGPLRPVHSKGLRGASDGVVDKSVRGTSVWPGLVSPGRLSQVRLSRLRPSAPSSAVRAVLPADSVHC